MHRSTYPFEDAVGLLPKTTMGDIVGMRIKLARFLFDAFDTDILYVWRDAYELPYKNGEPLVRLPYLIAEAMLQRFNTQHIYDKLALARPQRVAELAFLTQKEPGSTKQVATT